MTLKLNRARELIFEQHTERRRVVRTSNMQLRSDQVVPGVHYRSENAGERNSQSDD